MHSRFPTILNPLLPVSQTEAHFPWVICSLWLPLATCISNPWYLDHFLVFFVCSRWLKTAVSTQVLSKEVKFREMVTIKLWDFLQLTSMCLFQWTVSSTVTTYFFHCYWYVPTICLPYFNWTVKVQETVIKCLPKGERLKKRYQKVVKPFSCIRGIKHQCDQFSLWYD